ncbi:MAG: hypothetical protein HY548_00980, partial [Elusimicrobia bacterium]|nr:hypothetical protein [Elusimicrobiota bacterium]
TLTLEPNTNIEWLAKSPKLEISVDGQKLSPADSFSSSPYALVAQKAENVVDNSITAAKITDGAVTNVKLASNLNLDASKIAVYTDTNGGVTTLASWRDSTVQYKINAEMIQGTVPVSTSQIPGTALVAHATFTQTMEPKADNIVSPVFVVKPVRAETEDILTLKDSTGNNTLFVAKHSGNVGIGTANPGSKLEIAGSPVETNGLLRLNADVGTGTTYPLLRLLNTQGTGNQNDIVGIWGDIRATSPQAKMLRLDDGTNTRFTVEVGGNVGIGTANPSTTLHVNGKITHTHIGARVTHSVGGVTIQHNTYRYLPFDQERYDTDNLHDISENNSRLTANRAGKYLIFANISYNANASGSRQTFIELNRSNKIAGDVRPAVGGSSTAVNISTIYPLQVNDYVEVVVLQDSGGALDIDKTGSHYSPEFGMTYLGE